MCTKAPDASKEFLVPVKREEIVHEETRGTEEQISVSNDRREN